MDFTFRPLVEPDLASLHDWLSRPHVTEHWGPAPTLDDVRQKYLPRTQHSSSVAPFIALLHDRPVGYIQSYPATETPDGWWHGQHDEGVRGIDQFLADPQDLGHGIGTAMITRFVELLFAAPSTHRIQVDPDPRNGRAIRCYEKVGFQRQGLITTPDGEALLMFIHRDGRPRSSSQGAP